MDLRHVTAQCEENHSEPQQWLTEDIEGANTRLREEVMGLGWLERRMCRSGRHEAGRGRPVCAASVGRGAWGPRPMLEGIHDWHPEAVIPRGVRVSCYHGCNQSTESCEPMRGLVECRCSLLLPVLVCSQVSTTAPKGRAPGSPPKDWETVGRFIVLCLLNLRLEFISGGLSFKLSGIF